MQRPRHYGYLRAALKLSILLVALAALAGCREDRAGSKARTAAEYQRMLDSSGKRVLVVDAVGEPVAKLRKRTDKYKVYDAQLSPAGFVRWEPSESADSEPAESEPPRARARVSARPLTGDDAREIEQVSEGNFELGAALRIERTDRGWAVFGPDAELVGLFERGDSDTWHLRRSYEQGARIEAETTGERAKLTHDGETLLEVRAGQLSALELLALELDGISMLHRVAVGVWMEHARPQG